MDGLHIELGELPPECETLRQEVRAFIAEHMAAYSKEQRAHNWTGRDSGMTRKMAQQGWLGMTWPRKYGGAERSMLERYVMLEEMLAVGAPMGAHWSADRQMGPLLMRYAAETLAPRIVPRIVSGECAFCIGMSEPDSGSDLASIRTRAVKVEGGWKINGTKVWTSGAHHAQYMVALVRTRDKTEDRHAGMTQFLVEMDRPGLKVNPIYSQLGTHIFNEVVLDDVFVPDENLIGTEGEGWKQVTSELKFERSGPERFLSSTQLLIEMIDAADPQSTDQTVAIGKLIAKYAALRQMSQGIALMMSRGEDPALAASVVKDQGALMEQSIPNIAHDKFGEHIGTGSNLEKVMNFLLMASPSFSLRGGTREILRGIIARGMGLR
ncbi:acyl-CoA dehydrogenase family protein [Comamonas sp. w2-DMI]|uniref:Acyl-CoA dehydrogenase domain protein n=1 Tax=Comamonas testosteroni (strain DSM 14576 / KF-1) TaxID=399795 RepID=B7WRJ2_COMTK|nr:acyl-CoA dehydrogenase family protein [Comamonas testosteroni]EED67177.1 acyl-CoA dehydrogenase domain protein [Comamonas testosteroni KF-1]WQG65362.1 acyl-CoA dehydrogenase family protein [Comamonas testosteroni]